ncbi:MAG TPA: HAMP domain-containing sensor histidine kinase, partial [Adhaeribacter sp.]|nr:HAMP domain-containing sensor histidine kinase [Adhaeribacter sp.]
MKLQAKLALFNALSKGVMVAAAVLVLPWLINRIAISHADRLMKVKEEKVMKIVNRVGIERLLEPEKDSSFASYNLLKDEFISLEAIDPEPEKTAIYNGKRELEGEVVEYRILNKVFRLNDDYYLLEIGRSLRAIQERHAMMRSLALVLLLSIGIITVFTDITFTRYLLRPLNRIIETKLRSVHHPSTFNFTPVQTTTQDFQYLDSSINDMMQLIAAAFEKEREFMSNVAHELLTPISILQNRFENLLAEENLPEPYEVKLLESLKTLNRLKTVIRSLLLISKIENDQYLKTDSVNIKELLEEVVSEVEDRLESKNLQLHLTLPAPVPVLQGNRPLLFTMFFNLINNAIKYNHESGQIFI